MKRLRLFASNTSGAIDRTYSRFPVRIGRHPQNELQIVDPRISRFHAQFDCESGVLVYRDVGSQNGTVVMDGVSGRVLRVVRGADVPAPDGRLAVLIGGVRLQARLEEGEAAELPDAFAPAARGAASAILSVCRLQGEPVSPVHGGAETTLPVLDALLDSLFTVRLGLHADEMEPAAGQDGEPVRRETLSALLAWTQANAIALRCIEHSLQTTRDRDARLLSEGIEAIDVLLRELAPEKLESETKDVCAEWPAARATAVLARYREAHRQLVQRHARRPSGLLGKTFAELYLAQQSNEQDAAASAGPRSGRRARIRARTRADALLATSADTGEQPPSSDSK